VTLQPGFNQVAVVCSARGPRRHLVALPPADDHLGMEPEDMRVLFEVLFDIRSDVRRALWLLEGEDDEEEEEDS
jgi:hypothetical protein